MENNQQPLPSKQQAEQPYSVSPTTSRSPSKTFIILIVGILTAAAGVGGYFLGVNQSQVVQNQPQPPTTISQPSPTPVDETANWKTYNVKTLQLQFMLPPKFTQLGQLKENVEKTASPFTGRRLCVTFSDTARNCEMNHFLIITISSDYNVGRGAGFVDLQGFMYVDGRYYARLLEKEFEIPSNLVQRINNENGVEIIRIKGAYTSLEDEPLPIYYAYPGENTVGALVNTSDKTFPGFAVLFELKDGFTEEDFDQILSTFKFTPLR